MADGDAEILPPRAEDKTPQSIVINQFFQLVNKNTALPDGDALARYTQEDKEWIKERVNYEQEQRLALFNKYMDYQHEREMNDNNHEHDNARHRQNGAIGIVGASIVASSTLLYLGAGYLALGLPAVVLLPGVASGITSFVTDKLRAAAKDKPPDPPSKG
jgi:hypothetical protein